MLGEPLFTRFATPAVVLYVSTLALQAFGWRLMTGSALRDGLVRDEHSIPSMRRNWRDAAFAFAFYTVCAIAAFWIPLPIAAVTILVWIYWLIASLRLKQFEEATA